MDRDEAIMLIFWPVMLFSHALQTYPLFLLSIHLCSLLPYGYHGK